MRKIFAVLMLTGLLATGCSQDKGTSGDNAATGTAKGGNAVFTLTSTAFKEGQQIPTQYANVLYPGGKDVSVPLAWAGAPAGAKSFALICVDRNPAADNWIHWVVINIPGKTTSIAEGASNTDKMPAGAKELQNTFTNVGYSGPTPPPGTGTHDYEFTLYALRTELIEMPEIPTLAAFEAALQDELIVAAKLKGTLVRQ